MPANAHPRALDVGPGGQRTEAPCPPDGAARGPRAVIVSDPEAVVEKARKTLRLMEGERFTPKMVSLLARLVWLDFPKLTRKDVEELAGPDLVMGDILAGEVLEARARNIAAVAIAQGAA